MIKKTTREIVIYEIEGKDLSIIRQAVNYAFHRAEKHGKKSAGNAEELQRIRVELDII